MSYLLVFTGFTNCISLLNFFLFLIIMGKIKSIHCYETLRYARRIKFFHEPKPKYSMKKKQQTERIL